MMFDTEPTLSDPGPFFGRCVDALAAGGPFVYSKLNHGFWERLVCIWRMVDDVDAIDDARAQEVERTLGFSDSAFVHTGFLKELLVLLGKLPLPSEGFHFSAAIDPWPRSQEIEGTPWVNRFACLEAINAHVSPPHLESARNLNMTGFEFKAALIAGLFQEFARPLAEQPFLLVANPKMAAFGAFVGARDMDHLPIDGAKARYGRWNILDETLRRLAEQRRLRRVVMQAGGSLSTWLCHHLFRARPDIQIFDLGNAMSVCAPEVARRQNWVRVYARSIFHGARKVHHGWFEEPNTACANAGKAKPAIVAAPRSVVADMLRDPALVDLACENGIPPPPTGHAAVVPVTFPDAPVSFIENKALDFQRIQQFIGLSLAVNHHANGGPVSRLLEAAVARLLRLPPGRKVVACTSATSALFLATSLLAYKGGRRSLRWVASAYGFFSCNIGPLADTLIIDCDENGRFSLEQLRQLPLESWDGVIFTNLFAQHGDWGELRDFCHAAGKFFVVDNAVGLLDRPADSHARGDIEAVSCHHTKPWGMGEGGLLIVDEGDEADIRGLMNFGAVMPPQAQSYATNAKISDLASAAILDRLERMTYWSTLYRMQARRIRSVLDDYGAPLHLLPGQSEAASPRAYLPLIAPKPVHLSRLRNECVVLRKYYRPLTPTPPEIPATVTTASAMTETFQNAEALYSRIICCPCNPELRLLESERLADTLRKALA